MISTIDQLLDQPSNEVQLQHFLDDYSLVEECHTQNERLIDYLVQSETINELILQLIRPTDSKNIRNIYVVSELFSSDFPKIQDALLKYEHFSLFYSFLSSSFDEQTQNVDMRNTIVIPNFCRILTTLIIRRPMDIIRNLKLQSTFIDDIRRHFDSITIIDILYSLISDSGEQQSEVIQWYLDIELIDALIETLLMTNSISIQINIVNLLNEFLNLTFEQYTTSNDDTLGNYKQLSFDKTTNEDLAEGTTSAQQYSMVDLVEKLIATKNLEHLFEKLISTPSFATTVCDLLSVFVDLLSRHLPTPIAIPFQLLCDENSLKTLWSFSTNSSENQFEKDDKNPVNVSKSTISNYFKNNHKDALIRLYLNFLEAIKTNLSNLIHLLSQPSTPLIASSNHDDSQVVKYQFISEPVGSGRLKLIRFFFKLIHLIGNDYTGDSIYKIFDENDFLNIIVDLFHQHIYNNFLHTQVYFIIQTIVELNVTAVKKLDYIWMRSSVFEHNQTNVTENQDSSPFFYTNRNIHKLFQGLLESSKVNLIERLLDQYELNSTSNRSMFTSSSDDECFTSTLLNPRFTPPNSGHIVQILDCLREHASTFDNYSAFFCTHEDESTNDRISLLQLRWFAMLDILHENEKKRNSLHHNQQFDTPNAEYHLGTGITKTIHESMVVYDLDQENHNDEELFLQSFPEASWLYTNDDNENTVSIQLESDRLSTNLFNGDHDFTANDQNDLRENIETINRLDKHSEDSIILKRYNHENILHITQLQSALSSISTNEIDGFDEEF